VLAFAGCGDAARERPVSDLSGLPLVELQIESQRGGDSELRVLADGRFEIRTDEADWKLVRQYSDADLDELRSEMQRADDPPLPARVDGGRHGSNPTRMTWRLRLADELREVVVEEWRDGAVPPLERLYRKLFTIPGGPAVESVWRVRVDGDVVERRVVGEATAVPELAAMLAALYERPAPFDPAGGGERPGELLVDVRHRVDGKPGDGFAVAPDGRAFLTEAGATTEVRRLDTDELARLRDAIAATHWPALPDPLAGSPSP
jgi:hypothetical protein